MVEQAWRGANFANAGSKLKDLSHYLPRPDDTKPSIQPEAVLDAMLTMKAHGVPMKIVKVEAPAG